MSVPVRIQLSRAKGWRMPENTVKVDRSTRFGNPFTPDLLCLTGPRQGEQLGIAEAVQAFRNSMATNMRLESQRTRELLDLLRGKNLACWCKLGEPCHADVLLELANVPATGS